MSSRRRLPMGESGVRDVESSSAVPCCFERRRVCGLTRLFHSAQRWPRPSFTQRVQDCAPLHLTLEVWQNVQDTSRDLTGAAVDGRFVTAALLALGFASSTGPAVTAAAALDVLETTLELGREMGEGREGRGGGEEMQVDEGGEEQDGEGYCSGWKRPPLWLATLLLPLPAAQGWRAKKAREDSLHGASSASSTQSAGGCSQGEVGEGKEKDEDVLTDELDGDRGSSWRGNTEVMAATRAGRRHEPGTRGVALGGPEDG